MAYKKILVPVDGSDTAALGLREAIRLGSEQGASIHLVNVVDEHFLLNAGMAPMTYSVEMIDTAKREGRNILKRSEDLVRKAGLRVASTMLETMTAPVAELIVRVAKRVRPDVIVIGTHGRRGVRRLIMGSDAEHVVRASPVPVLLVRGKEAAPRRKRA